MTAPISAARARNGNPGVVPPSLANPSPKTREELSKPAPAPAPGGAAPAPNAHGPLTLGRIDLAVAPGMQGVANAVSAAAAAQGVHPVHGTRDLTVVVPYSFEELQRAKPQVSDSDAREAMSTLKDVQRFFANLGVGSRDGNGPGLPVYFKPDFPNAAFARTKDGRDVLIIGNDPKTGTSFAMAPDVLAHEYTHRVLDTLVGMGHRGEPATVNESLADTFAAAFDADDWTIGEDVRPGGMRSMDHPDRPQDALRLPDGQVITKPAHVDDFIATSLDRGGAHINMGIPNRAATVIGNMIGRDAMAQIYIDAARSYLTHDSGISDEARATYAAAIDRFGERSAEAEAVRSGWDAVGLRMTVQR